MQQMENELWCIVYISCAVKGLSLESAREMMNFAISDRRSKNLSGLSINAMGNIMVLTEGEKSSVLKNFEEIKKHHVHHSVTKIYEGPIPCRFFEDYPLALKIKGVNELKELDDFNTPEKMEYLEEVIGMDFPALKVIKNFLKNNT